MKNENYINNIEQRSMYQESEDLCSVLDLLVNKLGTVLEMLFQYFKSQFLKSVT